jgi:type I restriction enzyme S subunit
MIRMNNLQDEGWDFSDLKYIQLPQSEAEKYRLEVGDILFNRTNSKELVGKCEVFREQGHWVFASYLIRVRLDETKALPDFVSTFLNTTAGRAQIDRVSRQIVGMSNVNAEELRALQIPVPSLAIQQELVTKIDIAREARKQKLAQAESILGTIDTYLLKKLKLSVPIEDDQQVFAVHLSQIKEGGRLDTYYHQPKFEQIVSNLSRSIKLDDLLTDIHYGASVSNDYTLSGIPFLRIKNLKPCEIDITDVVHLPEEMRNELGKAFVSSGDFLISRSGSIGIVAVVPPECNGFAFGSFMIRFAVVAEANKDYLAIWLNSLYARVLMRRDRIGAIQGNITIETIRNFPILLPDETVQKQIVAEVKRLREEARRLRWEAEEEWSSAKSQFEKKLLGVEV